MTLQMPEIDSTGHIIYRSYYIDSTGHIILGQVICVSSCLGKFFTLILNTRLNNFLEENNILNNYQIGFHTDFEHLIIYLFLKH